MPEQEPSATPEAVTVVPTTPPTAEPTPERESNGLPTHTVEVGDTLLGLARAYDVPMAAIQLENDLGGSTVLQTGETLTIPSNEGWEGASPFWVVHEVQPGETLIEIARAYDVELDELQAVNGLDDADRITVGQQLILPLGGPAAPQVLAPTEQPRPTAAEPTTTAAPAAAASTATPRPESAGPATLPGAAVPAELADWPREIARLINEVRAEHGLPPYTYNETLELAAQRHANDCAQRGWCSHTGSDGANIKTRVLRAGYEARGWAECWAQTQTPQRAVEVWMNETPPNDPHRRTLLSDWFTEIGLGVSRADWGNYIIANFGRP
jgi:uncharacterized protein YkwD